MPMATATTPPVRCPAPHLRPAVAWRLQQLADAVGRIAVVEERLQQLPGTVKELVTQGLQVVAGGMLA